MSVWAYFWNSFAFGVTAEAVSSVYATAVLAILSFIDSDSNKTALSNFKETFKYSMVVVSVATVMSFWACGVQIVSSVAYIGDDQRLNLATLRIYFVIGSTFIVSYLLYAIYKIQFIFCTAGISQNHEVSMNEMHEHELSDVLNEIDGSFSEKYLSAFEEAEVEVKQLSHLSASQIVQHLKVPFGPALKMAAHFATLSHVDGKGVTSS